VLDDLKAGSVIVVADKWGVSVKTVRRIIKDKSRILSAPAGAKRVRMRGDGKPTFEKRMIEWMELVRKTKTTTLTVTMNSTPHIIIMVTVPTSNHSRTRTLNREVGRVDLRGNLRQHVALLPDQCGGVHVYLGKDIVPS
jgi:hypothetical protein